MKRKYDMSYGASVRPDGVEFRLWAPSAEKVELSLLNNNIYFPMEKQGGTFSVLTDKAEEGSLYYYRINEELLVPDPVSRFQPEDVHGPSMVVDPASFGWEDTNWKGLPWEQVIFYELHIGSFTNEGTYTGIINRLPYLKDLGITAIELMPIADFPGKQNWGYDGVLKFAPDSVYGTPSDLKNLIQSCHKMDMMIFLDVVYNHFGPDGNYLYEYASDFFTNRYNTPWGDAINFDGKYSEFVRTFFIENALYWLIEYNFDGLRFDAADKLFDNSEKHILKEITERVRKEFEETRNIYLTLENNSNQPDFLEQTQNYLPKYFNAQWNDDIHHVYHVIATGEVDGYYIDYKDKTVWQLGRALSEGFVFQGEPFKFDGGEKRGGNSSHLSPASFVSFMQNHDQVGNRINSDRIISSGDKKKIKSLLTIFLISPNIPLLFMGEEYGCTQPFYYFCDFNDELADKVRKGRLKEIKKYRGVSGKVADCNDPTLKSTFEMTKLNWNDIDNPEHSEWLSFYKRLIKIRNKDIVPVLKDIIAGKSSFEIFNKTGLRVQWDLVNGNSLVLNANLSDNSIEKNDDTGKVICSYPEDIPQNNKVMEPFSVVWYLT